jgi:carbon storage regulator
VLVFTRKLDEAIIIGDGIEVRVLRIGKDGVRIGVTAAPHVPVHRREIYDQIRSANATAAADPKALNQIAARLRVRRADLSGPPPGAALVTGKKS